MTKEFVRKVRNTTINEPLEDMVELDIIGTPEGAYMYIGSGYQNIVPNIPSIYAQASSAASSNASSMVTAAATTTLSFANSYTDSKMAANPGVASGLPTFVTNLGTTSAYSTVTLGMNMVNIYNGSSTYMSASIAPVTTMNAGILTGTQYGNQQWGVSGMTALPSGTLTNLNGTASGNGTYQPFSFYSPSVTNDTNHFICGFTGAGVLVQLPTNYAVGDVFTFTFSSNTTANASSNHQGAGNFTLYSTDSSFLGTATAVSTTTGSALNTTVTIRIARVRAGLGNAYFVGTYPVLKVG